DADWARWHHRQQNECRAGRFAEGKGRERHGSSSEEKRSGEASGAERRQGMKRGPALGAIAVFALALLAGCLIGGGALAQAGPGPEGPRFLRAFLFLLPAIV